MKYLPTPYFLRKANVNQTTLLPTNCRSVTRSHAEDRGIAESNTHIEQLSPCVEERRAVYTSRSAGALRSNLDHWEGLGTESRKLHKDPGVLGFGSQHGRGRTDGQGPERSFYLDR